MKKSIIAIAIAASATAGIVSTASACSSVSAITDHGTLTMRSMDWAVPVEAIAKVTPVGTTMVSDSPSYKTQATWKTKYHTVSLYDENIFKGTAYDAFNDQGMSVHGQYMEASEPFLELHKNNDNGAPAVDNGQLATFIASNYKNVDEAITGLDKGEWQPAYSDLMMGMTHLVPAHFNIRDKEGNVALIQLNANGELKVWRGSANDNLRFVTNEPLYQEHIEYLNEVSPNMTANNVPADYSSLNRYVRGLHHAKGQSFEGLNYQQTMAAQRLSFHSAVAIPLDLDVPAEPRNGKGAESMGVFPTFFTTQYNLNTGDVVHDNLYDGQLIKFNLEDTKNTKVELCANLTQQSEKGEFVPKFEACE
ncbi:linear amide C-N hydrolase [Vibrio sinaloensis]|uniref:linear amide C-N hydrolase n=1 Tax=Photobacterium sp. (strain ATCC 43367) TaxID=379097 RepID=UPI002060E593|nr:linear amide C-N hydrolase [Vibrio sinaloensis]UPQ89463.1 linear amide C-N hydrolase [Vibrio sinaloensis]